MNNYFVRSSESVNFVEYCVKNNHLFKYQSTDWINDGATILYTVEMTEEDALRMKLTIPTMGIMNLGKKYNTQEKL